MKIRMIAAIVSTFCMYACTNQPKRLREPVRQEVLKKQTAKEDIRTSKPQDKLEACQPYESPQAEVPAFVRTEPGGFIVTRVVNPCVTRDGLRGFGKGSPWMAMGIPCTSGPGTINIRGRSYAPKMISLSMSTDCKMHPEQEQIAEAMRDNRFGFGPENKLLAYNPFSVQYWEIEGFKDAGVGDAIELRTTESINFGWIDFKDKGKPLSVHLFGRENAWVQDAKMYQVKVELEFVRPLNFKAKILEVKVLNENELKSAKQRCIALGLRQRCAEVFN